MKDKEVHGWKVNGKPKVPGLLVIVAKSGDRHCGSNYRKEEKVERTQGGASNRRSALSFII